MSRINLHSTWHAIFAFLSSCLLIPCTSHAGASVDLQTYCTSTYGSSYSPILTQPNAYGWACTGNGESKPINVDSACKHQYSSDWHANYANYEDPYSWYCAPNVTVSIDLNQYCFTTYGNSAYAVLINHSATGWRCEKEAQFFPINESDACIQQYPNGVAAVTEDADDPFSWTCTLSTIDYSSIQGKPLSLYPWKGVSLALLTPDTQWSTLTLSKVLTALDKAYAFYASATGQTPSLYKEYQSLDTVAVVTSTCGAGCGYLGATGIEIEQAYFDALCNGIEQSNQYDQILFYELGRNFWFYSSKIEYMGQDNTGTITTGYAILMRFLSMEAANVQGAPYNGVSFSEFKLSVTKLLELYLQDSTLNWNNTLKIGQAPANPLNLGATDLFASFVMRLMKVNGGYSFINKLWKEVAKRPDATSTQDAVDNFAIAASSAAHQNLSNVFTTAWRWPLSEKAQQLLRQYGRPANIRPYL